MIHSRTCLRFSESDGRRFLHQGKVPCNPRIPHSLACRREVYTFERQNFDFPSLPWDQYCGHGGSAVWAHTNNGVRTHHASFQTWLHSKYFHISTNGGIFTDGKKHRKVIFLFTAQKKSNLDLDRLFSFVSNLKQSLTKTKKELRCFGAV